jgi:hypothetical protein
LGSLAVLGPPLAIVYAQDPVKADGPERSSWPATASQRERDRQSNLS